MPTSISNHAQSTLPDGRVLISGGGVKCYIYTPNSNTWEEVASLPASIRLHGQSTIIDGSVLISGGDSANGVCYVYTPSDNVWTTVASLPTGVSCHGQSTFNDGTNRVIVSGGSTSWGSAAFNTVYIYTPNANGGSWANSSPMLASFNGQGQSTLFDGRILVSGGTAIGTGAVNTAYIYTPTGTGSWVSVTPLPTTGRYGLRQSTLADNRVLVSGGYAGGNVSSSYIYTVGSNSWATIASLPLGTHWHGQSILADGRVLVTGGTGGGNTAYIYTPTGWVAHIKIK